MGEIANLFNIGNLICIFSSHMDLVPTWGDVDLSVLAAFRHETGLTDVELEVIAECYKQDIHNVFYLVRNDWHPPVDDMAITRHEECRENTQDRLQAHPLSNVIHFSFDAEHRLCDEDPLPGSFAGHLLRTLRFHIMLNMTDPSGKRENYLWAWCFFFKSFDNWAFSCTFRPGNVKILP